MFLTRPTREKCQYRVCVSGVHKTCPKPSLAVSPVSIRHARSSPVFIRHARSPPWHGPHWTLDCNHRDNLNLPGFPHYGNQLQLVLGPMMVLVYRSTQNVPHICSMPTNYSHEHIGHTLGKHKHEKTMPLSMLQCLCDFTVNETLKWLSLMQESFWWCQCSVRYCLPLPPPTGISVPATTSWETTWHSGV